MILRVSPSCFLPSFFFSIISSFTLILSCDVMSQLAAATEVTIDDGAGATSYQNYLPPDNEVHVIGVYETTSRGFQQHPIGIPQVNVVYDRTKDMKPITLVLSSYEPNNWQLNIDSRAVVEKIILNGHHEQTVTGAGDIPVMNFSRLSGGSSLGSGSYAYRWPLSTGGSSTQKLLVAVEKLLNTRISSFTGQYRASRFTVPGSPADQQVVNPQLGAGNLFDGPNPDLIYDARTGEVQIDLSDLAAQYPFESGEIWWQHFDAQRLFVSLANHDGSFDVGAFDPSGMNQTGGRSLAINENRLGYDGVSLRNWQGELISLGEFFPRGMNTLSTLQEYLAAATFATDRESGEFDLVLLVPEPSSKALLFVICLIIIGLQERFPRLTYRGLTKRCTGFC